MAIRAGHFGSAKAREKFVAAYGAAEALYPIPWRDLEVPTSYGPTYVRSSGDGTGTPLVLIHGFQGNSLMWSPVIERLARRRTVYLPDIIGTPGRSVQTEPIVHGAEMARWLGEVLTGLELPRAHLVAFSHGGRLAGMLAGQSSIPASLTLIEPGSVLVPVRTVLLARMVLAGIRPTSGRTRRLLAKLQPGVPTTPEDTELATAAIRFRMSLPYARVLADADLTAIATPTLVLCGGGTVLYDPAAAVTRARALIPNVETEVFPEVSHGLLAEVPRSAATRLLQFTALHDLRVPRATA
ncbi:alpha/beta fold hydrolase [Nocardia jiangsuensis]|uniref:Alpha/beta fold hydrolase n=1 Tax=Nocardia jiangsuensis TaxID=1691563 RepID=A0ABV8DW53_9NOCA